MNGNPFAGALNAHLVVAFMDPVSQGLWPPETPTRFEIGAPSAGCHGSLSSFRDFAAEQTHTPHAVTEAALAHVIKNKAEAAYARSDLFEKRRALMESWSETVRQSGEAEFPKELRVRVLAQWLAVPRARKDQPTAVRQHCGFLQYCDGAR